MQPEKVVLFGSYANGIPTEDSDLDILVVKETNLPASQRLGDLKNQLRDLKLSIDIIVRNKKELEKWKNVRSAFLTQIMTEGTVLYGK